MHARYQTGGFNYHSGLYLFDALSTQQESSAGVDSAPR